MFPELRPSRVARRFFASILCALLTLAGLTPEAAWAAPTSTAQARLAAAGWRSREAAPLGAALAPAVGRVESFRDAQGEPLYHIVHLTPAGLVIVAGDDLIEPIVGFLPAATTYTPSDKNPLGALVARDLPGRVRQARQRQAEAARLGRAFAPAAEQAEAQNKWRKLLEEAAGGGSREEAQAGLSDVRVAPLVQSRWDQADVAGAACYNYYTPPGGAGTTDNYPCGCVATAMAQLLRFHQYPTVGVGTGAFTIKVDGSARNVRLRGGNGSGGTYAWASMPLAPGASMTTAQRQAVGTLSYDAGISVNMEYAADGSGADTLVAATSLKSVFKYGSAVKGYNNGAQIGGGLPAMVNPNLDAGLPVLLGITSSYGGHAIVCDGYGYNGATPYHHLNLGWSGLSNAWYNLPTIDAAIPFDTIYKVIYNVYPSGTGEIISGRVTGAKGAPVAGATVTATRTGGGTYTATTNAQGIYALKRVPAKSTYAIKVAKSKLVFGSRTVSTGQSSDLAATAGNLWGVNFAAAAAPEMAVTPATAFGSAGGRGGPFTPASMIYTVKNAGTGTLTWTAAKTPAWATLSKTGGSLAAGASATVVVSINTAANALATGAYAGTVTFTNTVNGLGNGTRAVSLKVLVPNTWTLAAAAAPWEARDNQAMVAMGNKLWLLGGWGMERLNDVWSSGDGVNWTQVTAAAPWGVRSAHAAAVFNNRIYVMGGENAAGYLADVWSSGDGLTWTRRTAAAPWGGRARMAVVVFGGKLWLLGGNLNDDWTSGNDVWSSSDGAAWTRVTAAAPWSARNSLRAEVFGGRIYVMGGSDGFSEFNDVWSSADGRSWTRAVASAPWAAREAFASAVIDNKLWVMGGYNADLDADLNDVWTSANGTAWTRAASAAPWPAREGMSAAVFLNRLYLLGGWSAGGQTDLGDLWHYLPGTAPAALSVTPSTGLTAAGPAGGAFTPASTVYTLKNTGGAPLAWSVSKTFGWLTLWPSSGTLAPGASVTMTVTFYSSAKALAAGSYANTIAFTNATNSVGNTTRPVKLTVNPAAPAAFVVTPATGLTASGQSGGPFSPASMVYTLKNTGGSSLNWTAAKTFSWLSLSASRGTLAPGASATLKVSVNSGANALAAGSHPCLLAFTNASSSQGSTTRPVQLNVQARSKGER